jgi:hypothetical protein
MVKIVFTAWQKRSNNSKREELDSSTWFAVMENVWVLLCHLGYYFAIWFYLQIYV